MRLSPGMRDNIAKSTSNSSDLVVADTDSLHIKLIEFEEDRKYLRSAFNTIADRIEYKRKILIPKYKSYLQAFIDSKENINNPIFSNVLIWLFDVNDFETAIDWCLMAIERNLPTPDNFKRNWPTICADSVLIWAQQEAEKGNSIEPYFSLVFDLIKSKWVLHEEICAKWFKFAGLQLIRNEKGDVQVTSVGNIEVLKNALLLLKKANYLYCKIGVKTHVKNIEQRIRAIESGVNL